MSSARDEFYVGYLERSPPALAAATRRRAAALLLLACVLAVALVAAMSPFSTSVFEFGSERSFVGVLREHPVPTLQVERPGGGEAGASRYLLVGAGKRGAAAATAGLDGRRVRLAGTLVHHDGRTMIELAGEPRALNDSPPDREAAVRELGRRTLVGEVVDSKCFLGVMKPGHTKPHRLCAVRCISGGIPPVLLVRDAEGFATYYVLVGSDGGAIGADLLDRIAEPVRVEGRLVRRDDLLFLHADPADVERIE